MKISNRTDSASIDWSRFKYMVFDVPNHHSSYRERYEHLGKFGHSFFLKNSELIRIYYMLEEYMAKHPCKYIEVAPKQHCKDTAHLEKIFQDIVDRGGEGIILRDPSSPYQPGRSPGYLKHKVRIDR